MAAGTDTFAGWRIAEALRRYGDRTLLLKWFEARRAWKADGCRTRFFYMSEYIDGYDAVRHNDAERISHNLRDRNEASYQRLLGSLSQCLKEGRLEAWGRRESPLNPSVLIPSVAWEYLVISNVRKSVVRERSAAKTEIFDVRIFPPDRPNRSANGSTDLMASLPTKKKAGARISGKLGSRTACFKWLAELMSKSIDVKPKPKADYWKEAQEKWPTLSERGFEGAWAEAVTKIEAFAWSNPGRTPKSPRK
jgi:hypothetical protein